MLFPLDLSGFPAADGDIDTVSVTQVEVIGARNDARTVGCMSTEHDCITPTAEDIFLDTEALAERYSIGTTKAKELVRSGVLPASVVPGMVRIPLSALRAWEVTTSLAGTAADPAQRTDSVAVLSPPPARRAGRPTTRRAA
jgi:hypothetical protein